MRRVRIIVLAAAFTALFGCAAPAPRVVAAEVRTDCSKAWLLHLPGIAGERRVDHELIHGFQQAGYDGKARIYDWTEHDPGLDALLAYERNHREAQKVADIIADQFHADPDSRIILTGHSGGTGLVVWALEDLPDDVKVQSVFLLASALSPEYDLTKALRHVRGNVYVFSSLGDSLVLGTGTRLFGTIDGIKSEAAGLAGFVMPKGADRELYAKLVSEPYQKQWLNFGHVGNHIGCMNRMFVANVMAPLLLKDLSGVIAEATKVAATQPSAGEEHAAHASTAKNEKKM